MELVGDCVFTFKFLHDFIASTLEIVKSKPDLSLELVKRVCACLFAIVGGVPPSTFTSWRCGTFQYMKIGGDFRNCSFFVASDNTVLVHVTSNCNQKGHVSLGSFPLGSPSKEIVLFAHEHASTFSQSPLAGYSRGDFVRDLFASVGKLPMFLFPALFRNYGMHK